MERGSGSSSGKAALMADGETAWSSGAGTVPALDVTNMQGRNAMEYRWELPLESEQEGREARLSRSATRGGRCGE